MKKITWLLALLLALAMLMGCGFGLTEQPGHTRLLGERPSPTRGETNATGPFDILLRGGNGFDMSFTLRNNSDEIFFYSDAYRLYVYADTWVLHHEHAGTGAEYYLRPGAVREIFVQWSGRASGRQIEPSRYRFVMETIEIVFTQLPWVDGEGSLIDTGDQDWLGFVMAGQPASGVEASNIVATSTGMTFTLENRSTSGIFYGLPFTVVRYEDGNWAAIPSEPAVWILPGFELHPGESRDYIIEWAWLYGELPAGRYMFIRDASLTSEPFVEEINGLELWSDIHSRYPTTVYLMIEFEL